jgi:predicted N-acyltransferase
MPSPHDQKLSVRTISSLDDVDRRSWNACANPAGKPYNPFVSHEFLLALEVSGSAVAETGWHAMHLVLEGADAVPLAYMPCYLKAHSRGEYVFDYGWAEAYERAGGRYYPKLQSSVPFTPVTGPRFLAGSGPDAGLNTQRLAQASMQLCDRLNVSSVHVTFLPQADWQLMASHGWLRRTDTQFHWHNDGFFSFDGYLDSLASRKRKNIRKERATALSAGLEIECLNGSDLKEHHWDAFFGFYLDTGSRKWGSPYLTRDFFSLVSEGMANDILLIMAKRNGRYIAGALNFIGGDALYGRNWGAIEHHDCLHFELCYYQAIDYAIANRLARVEAGAQGDHKLARGYLPVTTHSLHYLADPRLARAVDDYLAHERVAVAHDARLLARHSPYRQTNSDDDSF